MPVSRLISDLDLIITELNESSPAAPTVTDDLRLITARFNELQRQLDIAQLKLTSVTSMVELNTVEPQVDISPEPQVCNLRFKIPDNFSTNTPEIDEAHIAMFNVGNNLYCLVYNAQSIWLKQR